VSLTNCRFTICAFDRCRFR